MDRRRRSRSAPERLLERLLGLDIKLRQYEVGKRFCDAVVSEAGVEALNAVWRAPEMLPSSHELEHPGPGWIAPGRATPRLPDAGRFRRSAAARVTHSNQWFTNRCSVLYFYRA